MTRKVKSIWIGVIILKKYLYISETEMSQSWKLGYDLSLKNILNLHYKLNLHFKCIVPSLNNFYHMDITLFPHVTNELLTPLFADRAFCTAACVGFIKTIFPSRKMLETSLGMVGVSEFLSFGTVGFNQFIVSLFWRSEFRVF